MARASALDLLEEELLRAKAEALGRAGAKLKEALQSYRRLRAESMAAPADIDAAWERVMRARENLIVLREGIGLRRHDAVDDEYDIPLRHREASR